MCSASTQPDEAQILCYVKPRTRASTNILLSVEKRSEGSVLERCFVFILM